jgi:Clp protease.
MIVGLHNIDFNEEILEKVITAFNQNSEIVTIYLRSGGGRVSVMTAILDIINTNPDRFELVANDYIASAAFILFFKANCKKRILPNTFGMHHQMTTKISVNESGKAYYDYDLAELKRMEIDKKESQDFNYRIGLTKKEIKKYEKDYDLNFQYDRLLQMLEHYKMTAPSPPPKKSQTSSQM